MNTRMRVSLPMPNIYFIPSKMHPMHKIEVEEQIIDKLEEIDQTFSSINKVLKEINHKIEQLSHTNTKILEHSQPWLNFFNITGAQPVTDSVEHTNELTSSGTYELPAHKYDVSVDDALHSLNMEQLPEAFSSEHVQMIYGYVEHRGQVGLNDVYEAFKDVEMERMDIFIEMMIRKRFLGCRDGVLYTKRRSDGH